MTLVVRIKPRALNEIHAAAQWWSQNRAAAAGAIESDLRDALSALVEQPSIGSKVDSARTTQTRRLYLLRTRYFVYYRVKGRFLEVVAFWHSS